MISFDSAGARVFIQTNYDGSLVCDEDDRIVVWNPSCERIFGWTQEEVLGKRSNEFIVPQEMRHLHLNGIRRMTAAAKASEEIPSSNILDQRLEIDAQRKNGERFPVELNVSMFREEGMIYYVARIRDITEQREASRMHTVMIHELNHRVRNSLTVVQSLINNTLINEGVARSTISKVTERIGALGKAHSILAEENWHSGSLWSVVDNSIYVHGDRIRKHGPDVLLGPTAVVTASLVLHELATNAIKYGSLSNQDGKVDLTWFLAGNTVHMFWVESGGPPAFKPPQMGFGTKMIQRLVAAEIGASLEFFFETKGLKVELELPFFDAN